MRFWLLILSIMVARRLVVMIRRILRYCVDVIIGIVRMSLAEEMSSNITNGNGPKTGVEDMSALYLAGMIFSLFVMLYMVYRKETE